MIFYKYLNILLLRLLRHKLFLDSIGLNRKILSADVKQNDDDHDIIFLGRPLIIITPTIRKEQNVVIS